MSKINELTGFPPYFINSYLKEQLRYFDLLTGSEDPDPIIPVSPSNIDDLYNNYMESSITENPLMIVYDRMLRVNPSPFYARKREQLVYTIHSSSLENVINAHRVLSDALNRMDATAQDINLWSKEKRIKDDNGENIPANVFFHNFRVYQLNETRDVLDLSSVRTIHRAKVIVEYDYHVSSSFYN